MTEKWLRRIGLSLVAGAVILAYLLFVGKNPVGEVFLFTGLGIAAALVSTLSFGPKEMDNGPHPWWWHALGWTLLGALTVWVAVDGIRESGFAKGIFSAVLLVVMGAVSWISSLLDRRDNG